MSRSRRPRRIAAVVVALPPTKASRSTARALGHRLQRLARHRTGALDRALVNRPIATGELGHRFGKPYRADLARDQPFRARPKCRRAYSVLPPPVSSTPTRSPRKLAKRGKRAAIGRLAPLPPPKARAAAYRAAHPHALRRTHSPFSARRSALVVNRKHANVVPLTVRANCADRLERSLHRLVAQAVLARPDLHRCACPPSERTRRAAVAARRRRAAAASSSCRSTRSQTVCSSREERRAPLFLQEMTLGRGHRVGRLPLLGALEIRRDLLLELVVANLRRQRDGAAPALATNFEG